LASIWASETGLSWAKPAVTINTPLRIKRIMSRRNRLFPIIEDPRNGEKQITNPLNVFLRKKLRE
jgi:hypothetical protein